MKNKSILIAIALCVSLQSNISFSAQAPSWSETFRNYWNSAKNWASQKVSNNYTTAIPAAGAVAMGAVGLQDISQRTANVELPRAHTELGISDPLYVAGVAGSGLLAGAILAGLINRTIFYYKNGALTRVGAVKNIKNVIRGVLNNKDAYPTRSTKLHALLKKNEFLGYQEDPYGFVKEACDELIEEISQEPVTEDEHLIDSGINRINATLQGFSVQKQLDKIATTVVKAKMSILLRLRNKLAVEQQLSPEKKIAREELASKMTAEEREAIAQRKAMTKEQWKVYRQQKEQEKQPQIYLPTID